MNKNELLNLLNSLNLPKGEYYILGGGSLVLYGIKATTSDLDLCVSNELFDALKDRFILSEEKKNKYGFYQLSHNVEIIPNKKEDFNYSEVEGLMVETLERILQFKKSRYLAKDIEYIEKIENYLREH